MGLTITDIKRFVRLSDSMRRLGATAGARLQATLMPYRVFRGLDHPVQLELEKHGKPFSFWVRDRSHLIALEEVLVNDIYAEAAPENPNLIIDLGANIGASVLYFATRYPNATVIALEPDPESFALLQKNAMPLANVEVRHAAAGARSGQIQLARGRDSLANSTIVVDTTSKTVSVACVRLDELSEGRVVDLLKIDIEGAEFEVLKSANLSRVRCIVGEIHLGDATTREAGILTNLLPGFSVRFLASKQSQEPWDELRDFVATRSPGHSL